MSAIITSHSYIDFDCLGAMYGAAKLYPGAPMVIPGSMAGNVRSFVRLHQDLIEFLQPSQIDLSTVHLVILVDTHQISRTGELYPLLRTYPHLRYHVYDHHPRLNPQDIEFDKEVIRPCGSATTLVVEELRSQGVEITPFEATLMAIGIYEDTGNLTYSSTTWEDLEAAAFLLRKKADLAVINRFTNLSFTTGQRQLLDNLLWNAEIIIQNGFRIMICSKEWNREEEGLSRITQQLMVMEGIDVIFCLVKTGENTFIVGRSRIPEIQVNEILKSYGGGGHSGAAAARTICSDIKSMAEAIRTQILKQLPPAKLAREIMSSPVRNTPPDISVDEARQRMLRYGHGAIIVMDKGRVKGILTRKDTDKAIQLGLGNEPVFKVMSRSLHTIKPDTPLQEIERLMVEKNIGRLLVIQDKKPIGIITRTDLLRTLYHEKFPKIGHSQDVPPDSLSKILQNPWIQEVGDLSQQLGMNAYLVGGSVRDLILGIENPDIDIVLEGDAIRLAQEIKKNHPQWKIRFHESLRTAVLFSPEGQRIDMATARAEYYPHPGAIPEVESSSLKQDLSRRDFTINGLALRLNPIHFGEVIDFFGGIKDIKSHTLRILHNLSFMEDPIRILRGIRFEVKLGFRMDRHTQEMAQNALLTGRFDKLSGDRFKQELKYALSPYYAGSFLSRLNELGGLRLFDPSLLKDKDLLHRVPQISNTLLWYRHLPGTSLPKAEEWLIYLFEIFRNVIISAPSNINDIAQRFRLAKKEQEMLQQALVDRQEVLNQLKSGLRPSEYYSILKKYPTEAILYWLSLGEANAAILRTYIEIWQSQTLSITGKDLIQLGFKPGPKFQLILNSLLDAKLNGAIHTKDEELAMAKTLFQK